MIEAAFADRQITPEDRDLRVGNALLAQTLGELDMLIRDLVEPATPAMQPPATLHDPHLSDSSAYVPQQPIAYAPPQQAADVPAPQPPPAYTMVRSAAPRRQRPVLAMFVLALVVASVGASAVVSALRDSFLNNGPGGPQFGQVEDTYDLTAAGMSDFLDLYEGKFGHRTALNATFYDSYVVVDVPTSDGKSRHETWLYREAQWQRTNEATANLTGDVTVNLAKVNLSKLEANIAQAEATLGIDVPTQVYVLVGSGWTGTANSLAIHVNNKFGENAFMTTNLPGRVLQRYPFQAR